MSPEAVAKEIVRIGRERDRALAALRRLVSLKAHKEMCGVSDWYAREKLKAWEQARAVIGAPDNTPTEVTSGPIQMHARIDAACARCGAEGFEVLRVGEFVVDLTTGATEPLSFVRCVGCGWEMTLPCRLP